MANKLTDVVRREDERNLINIVKAMKSTSMHNPESTALHQLSNAVALGSASNLNDKTATKYARNMKESSYQS